MIQLPSSKGRQVPRGAQLPLFYMAPGNPAPQEPSPPQPPPSAPARNPNAIPKGGQIPMFMQAKELRALPPWPGDKTTVWDYDDASDSVSEDGREETDDELWERKLEESWDSPLYDSIEEEGVKRPVHVYLKGSSGARIHGQGHHRTAAAANINPDQFVPVLHSDNPMMALAGEELDGRSSGTDRWT